MCSGAQILTSEECLWARGVFDNYFSLVETTPVIDEARAINNAMLNATECVEPISLGAQRPLIYC